jgi:arginine/lysine/ornithine decarboxylase
MDQKWTPLYDALMRHKEQKPVSFHVPGHKNGQIFNEKARLVFESILTIDMTEISGLDDLHSPDGPILEAEQLLAELYQVKSSYFLVNGSTVGNLAMILATCEKSDVVLVQRNCHKSVLHGLMLAEVEPVFIAPEIDEEWGLAGGVRLKDLQEALQAYPQTKAIILTHPTYHGQSNELTEIVSIAHKKNIPVLVDEAHGAHFILGSPFPESAIKAGADVVVHSAHKTLPAMTMGSYLHVNSELINENRVAFYLQMLQSSSPSYPIMASLDLARAYLASFSAENKEILLKKISSFRDELKQIKDIDVMEGTNDRLDPLKITIRSKMGLSG